MPLDESTTSNKKLICKKLDKNESVILPTLSLPNDDDEELDQNNLFVIIQCGLVSFKVTRIPLNFCITRASPSDKKKIANLASSLGARITSYVYKSTTHLITPDSTSTAKVISAWALSIPIIIPKFVIDLSERTDSASPLPEVKNYVAEGRFKSDDTDNETGKAKEFLKNYTILTLMETESEMMCRCAGAEIVKLYDSTFWQKDGFIEDIFEKAMTREAVVCLINDTSRKTKKAKSFLEKKMKEEGMDGFKLSLISQMDIAKAISSLEVLCDVNGVPLPTKDTNDNSKNNNTNESVMNDAGNNEAQTSQQNNDDNKKEMEKNKNTDTNQSTKKLSPIDEQSESIEDHSIRVGVDEKDTIHREEIPNKSDEDSNVIQTSSNSVPTRTKRKNVEFSQDAEWISSKQSTGNSQSSIPSKRVRLEESQSSTGWISSQKCKSIKVDKNDDNDDQPIIDHDDEVDDKVSENVKPKVSLPVTNDGWMLVANGKPRVFKKQTIAQNNNNNNQDNVKRKDSKRFRKNSIITGATMNSINPIRLVSLLPKDSDRRRELELDRIENDRRQSAGDALFDDDVGSRKRGTGAIRSYLVPSNNSSTRRRRS